MNYEKKWGSSTPGHLVFLVDQSGSMVGENAKKTAEIVHSAILETLRGCTEGTDVKDRAYITVIGYGENNKASIIKEGWMSDWVSDLAEAKKNGTFVIPEIADSGTPMTEAFMLAKSCLEKWIEAREEERLQDPKEEMAAPIVINITDGMPNNESAARSAAQELMNISTPDGNVLLFNAHMSDDNVEIVLPKDRSSLNGVAEGEFLFDISSELTSQMIISAKNMKFEFAQIGSKGFVANARKSTLARFITFGSSVSQTK